MKYKCIMTVCIPYIHKYRHSHMHAYIPHTDSLSVDDLQHDHDRIHTYDLQHDHENQHAWHTNIHTFLQLLSLYMVPNKDDSMRGARRAASSILIKIGTTCASKLSRYMNQLVTHVKVCTCNVYAVSLCDTVGHP